MSNSPKSDTWLPGFSDVKTTHGGPPTIEAIATDPASTAIAIGDPVTISSGLISVASATSATLYGVAMEAATAAECDAGKIIDIAVGIRSNIFVGQCSGRSDGVDIGGECDIEGSTGAFYVNEDASTEGVLLIINHVLGDDQTDTSDCGRVEFVIKRSQYDALVAGK